MGFCSYENQIAGRITVQPVRIVHLTVRIPIYIWRRQMQNLNSMLLKDSVTQG